jgi:hypothetical protein
MNGVRRIAVSTLLLLALGPIGTAWAQVKVTSAEPAASVQGTVSLDVTINGSGFDSSASARFLVTGTADTGGVTVTKTVVKGPKQLVATIDVTDTAVVNKFDIEVTLSSGRKGKGTTLFTVLKKAGLEPDPCIGAESRRFPSFAFTRQTTVNGIVTWKTILADATGQCEKTVTTYSYNTFSSDLSFRYDDTSRSGVIVRVGTGFSQQAARLSVTFDTNGVPAVETSSYSSILTSADLPIPPDLLANGATLVSIGSGYLSLDGTALLVQTTLNDAAQSYIHLLWTCPFDSEILAVDRGNCRHVYQGPFAEVSGTWSARGDAIYVLQPAVSGSGTGLYRLTLSDGHFEQIWSRGTLWTFASSTLDSSLHERVAVYEADLNTGCAKALVVDADTCSNNDCLILNGAGHPVRGVLSWLPDGRVVSDGQTVPNRKGRCSNSGSITAFGSNDTTGGTTTLVTDGVSPHGAGGG